MTVAVNKVEARKVVGTVVTRKAPADAECLAVGQTLSFEPETVDYQQILSRKQWPKAKQVVKVRYRYLDGYCKHDGNDGPCRIEHYSVMP